MRPTLSFAALLTFALVACAEAPSDAVSSESAVSGNTKTLLALGDSMTFGGNPFLEADLTKVDPTTYSGYAEDLAKQLGFGVYNTACPGEASGSFLDAKAEDNGCRYGRKRFDLHVDWKSDTQAKAATDYLRDAIGKGRPPELVTMSIGGNDLMLLQKSVKDEPGPLKPVVMLARLPSYLRAYGEHVVSIIKAVDATGYAGKMVFITTYAPDYSSLTERLGISQFNDELRDAIEKAKREVGNVKVSVADVYAEFEKVADTKDGKTCDTGLLLIIDGKCDPHPTPAGHALIAKTIRASAGL